MIPENLTYEQLIKDMKACEQTKGLSVYDHGVLVNNYYHDLINHLGTGSPLKYEWKIPDWMYEKRNELFEMVFHDTIMGRYQINHDCGKPYCLDCTGPDWMGVCPDCEEVFEAEEDYWNWMQKLPAGCR